MNETGRASRSDATSAPVVLNTKPLFKLMVERKASDLFFTSNAPIKIKIEGQIHPDQQAGADAGSGARRRPTA